MTKAEKEIFKEVEGLLERADALEKAERENPQPKISYVEFMARRYGVSVIEMERRMGFST